MANIIIYPTGSTLNTNPHIIFSGTGVDYTIEIDTAGDLVFKSSTNIFKISDSATPLSLPGEVNVVNSELYVGNMMVVDSGGHWVGQTEGLKGQKGLKGLRGIDGDKGLKGNKGTQGIVGPTGDKGNFGIKGGIGLDGDKGIKGEISTKGIKVTEDHKVIKVLLDLKG